MAQMEAGYKKEISTLQLALQAEEAAHAEAFLNAIQTPF